LALASTAYVTRTAFMNMAGPISSTFQMESVTETERATTSGLMTMADGIPRSVTAWVAGAMMAKSDFYTPFLITSITYFVASSSYFVFFGTAEEQMQNLVLRIFTSVNYLSIDDSHFYNNIFNVIP
jgi:hypothetical protein